MATVTLRNTSHVGRVEAYPLQIARAGLVGIVFRNAGQLLEKLLSELLSWRY